eukprot:14419761-Alexandrium_andersonii.AAC.1
MSTGAPFRQPPCAPNLFRAFPNWRSPAQDADIAVKTQSLGAEILKLLSDVIGRAVDPQIYTMASYLFNLLSDDDTPVRDPKEFK